MGVGVAVGTGVGLFTVEPSSPVVVPSSPVVPPVVVSPQVVPPGVVTTAIVMVEEVPGIPLLGFVTADDSSTSYPPLLVLEIRV